MEACSIVDLTPDNVGQYGLCGYKDAKKHVELQRKIDWFRDLYPRGLRIKAMIASDGSYQGMIEFCPGEIAHRPVEATGYTFIHCLFVGFRKEFKGRGLATALVNECVETARAEGRAGVAVVTRKGSFMVDSPLFLKLGFEKVDTASPDFSLLALRFDRDRPMPCFTVPTVDGEGESVIIMRSAQCPYSVKNVAAMVEAGRELDIPVDIREIDTPEAARSTPAPFGTFCIVHRGEVISHHPISATRFRNIMKTRG